MSVTFPNNSDVKNIAKSNFVVSEETPSKEPEVSNSQLSVENATSQNRLAKGYLNAQSLNSKSISGIDFGDFGEIFKPTYTDPVSFATYNTWNANVDNEVNNLFQTTDIIGFQEDRAEDYFKYAAAAEDSHGVILGLENSYGDNSAIFYNKERFEPVHVESELLPGDDRAVTYAVLREKETGALIVVANVHLTAESHLYDQKVENFDYVQDRVLALQDQFDAEGAVLLGDFNLDLSSIPESGYQSGIDGVLVFGDDDIANSSQTLDGGGSDHNIVTREVQFQYNSEKTEDNFSHEAIEFHHYNIIFDPNQHYQRKDQEDLKEAFGYAPPPRSGRGTSSPAGRWEPTAPPAPPPSSPPPPRAGR